jgi:hypothetical protein
MMTLCPARFAYTLYEGAKTPYFLARHGLRSSRRVDDDPTRGGTLMTKRLALLCVPALVAGVLVTTASPAGASLPAGATKVTVTTGSNHSGINANLAGAASIAGQITAVAGGTVSASVAAYKGNTFVRAGFTDGTGHYLIGGLSAYATGYAVCVSAFSVFGGNSTTGYLGRCYHTAAFNGSTVPSTATKVPLTTGQQQTGINIAMPSGAAISGKITNSGGTALSGVSVTAKSKSSSATGFGFTTSTGTYKITGLPASSTGYAVCANPSFILAGTTGFRPRCWRTVAWNGGAIPSAANAVSVSVGHTHTGINIALPVGAAISGQLTDAGNGNPLKNAGVEVFNSSGGFLASVSTNSTGHYTVKGLAAAAGYRVCAFPFSPSATVQYHGKCWKTVAWNGGSLPSGTTAVSTTLGHTHTGINFKLSKTIIKLGSIAGTVTAFGSPALLQSAHVSLFSSTGSLLTTVSTNSAGAYKFSNLKANATGYIVCAKAGEDTFSPTAVTPDTGWAPRCHTDVAWGGLGVPGTANKVPLSTGQNRTGINVALHVGGEISGTANTAGLKTTTLGFVVVDLYTSSGHFLTSTSSSFTDGTYEFKNLAPSTTGYIVCFDGRDVDFGQPNYLPQCWDHQAWDGNT